MTKCEKLAEIIGVSVEFVEDNIDKGMLDILIELNRKGYITIFCCEGHLDDNDKWEGYIAFDKTYKFVEYPQGYYKYNNHRRFFYWRGNGEESRQEYLDNLLKWARILPTKEKEKVVMYNLTGRSKKYPNREPKLFYYGNDYEEVRCIMNRADIQNYFDFELYEDIKYF